VALFRLHLRSGPLPPGRTSWMCRKP
jgi:hypothetical protein